MLAEELGVERAAGAVALYEQIRAGRLDRVTSGKVTGDKVTRDKVISTNPVAGPPNRSMPCHPLTLSPCLLYTFDWAEMPAVDFFVERSAEVTQLTAWLLPVPRPWPLAGATDHDLGHGRHGQDDPGGTGDPIGGVWLYRC